jgi:hypothetical protein
MVAARGGGGLLLLSATSQAFAEGDAEAGRLSPRRYERAATSWAPKALRRDRFGADVLLDERAAGRRVLTLKGRRPHKAQDFDEVSNDDLESLVASIATFERP